MDYWLGLIADWVNSILSQVGNYITGQLNNFQNYFNQLFNQFYSWMQQVVNAIRDVVSSLATSIQTFFTDLLSKITTSIQAIWDKFINGIESIIVQVKGFITDVSNYLSGVAASIANSIYSIVSGIIAKVQDFLGGIVDSIKSAWTKIVDSIKGFLDDALSTVKDLASQIAATISDAIQAILGSASALISGVNQRLTDIRQGFTDAAAKLAQSVTGLSDDALKPIKDMIGSYTQTFLNAVTPAAITEVEQAFTTWAGGHTMALQSREDARQYWQALTPRASVNRWLFLLLAQVSMVTQVYSGVASANAAVVLQEFAATYPYKLVPPGDAVVLWRRGALKEEDALSILRRDGYSDTDARRIKQASEQLPGAGDFLSAWHRGAIGDTKLANGMAAIGIEEPYRSMLQGLSYVLPPVADLVTMAVREVWSDEIASRFGQFADFPERFKTEAAKQGLTEDWARSYWAAHWALPSAEQGFEMLHRGVIGPDDLVLLLKALDVMPFWRDKLTQIAYAPYTRVDIRRMNAVGILSEDDVLQAHKDLGYDAVKARNLTDFVLKLNRHKPQDEDVALGQLTRSTVLGFYEDGLIDRGHAIDLLVKAGLTADAAGLYVQQADLDSARTKRKEGIQLVLDRFAAAAITFEQAQSELGALNLTAREMDAAVLKLDQIRDRGTRLPTRTEAEAMVLAGVATLDDYKDLLTRLGYAPAWRDRFAAMLKEKASAPHKA